MVRRRAWLLPLACVALLVFGVPAADASAGQPGGSAQRTRVHHPARSYALLQMNLCLSGIAGCYPGTEYPAVVNEAIAKIQATDPEVVTLVETCGQDVSHIAAVTGYHPAFGAVIYKGERLPCVSPAGRGVYGIAVLTRAPILAVDDRPYAAQHGNEERRRVCATTVRLVTGCVTHLAVRDADPTGPDSVANDAQCAEFGHLLARYARFGLPALGAGDMNRSASCAPRRFWTRTDAGADQLGGIQHVYGSARAFRAPTARVLPMTYSDHDALLVRARR